MIDSLKTIKSFGFVFFVFLLLSNICYGQNLAERLGYPPDSKLLVIHADDMGVTHSVNSASISAFERGPMKSASLMVPTHWFPEMAAYARENPDFDLGLHLTLTSEWKYLQWGGVLPSNEIPSLINDEGYFYETVNEMVENANLEEVEKELKAQIERAIAFGVQPTHLDSHMGGPSSTAELFAIMMKLGQEFKIPVRTSKSGINNSDYARHVPSDYISSDNSRSLNVSVPAEKWNEAYDEIIENLVPGLNELVIHTAYDNEEMRATTIGKDHWYESAWRQRDYDYVVSQRFRDLIRKHNIQVITWREIQHLMYPETAADR